MDRIAFDNSDFRDLSLLRSATSLVPPFPSGNGRFFLAESDWKLRIGSDDPGQTFRSASLWGSER